MLHYQSLLASYVALRVLSKGALPPGPPRTVLLDRDAPFPKPNFCHRPRSSKQKEHLHKRGATRFHSGTVYSAAVTTPAPCSLQHHTFQLGLGRPEPCQPPCVVETLHRVNLPHCYRLPRDTGYGSSRNPEVRTRGWIYGRLQKGGIPFHTSVKTSEYFYTAR